MIMKKILLIIIFSLLIFSPAHSSDESDEVIYLDFNKHISDVDLKAPQKLDVKKFDLTRGQDYRVTPQNLHFYKDIDPYEKKLTTFKREKKHGNFTIGTKYETSYAADTFSQNSTMFSKYEKNRFSLNTSYKNNSLTSFNQQGKGIFSFSPEYKLNNHVSLQNIYSTNFLEKNKKNELVFTLKPFKDDRMNFDVGAGQIYSDNTSPVRSQLNFSTKIKF